MTLPSFGPVAAAPLAATSGSVVQIAAGIASTVRMGTLQKFTQPIRPAGINSTLRFGSIAGGTKSNYVTSITRTTAIGRPKFKMSVKPVGFQSTTQFGVLGAGRFAVHLLSVPRVAVLGIDHIDQFAFRNIFPASVTQTTRIGSPNARAPLSFHEFATMATEGWSLDEKPRTKTLAFGDGYRQVVPDALTPIIRTLTLTWQNIRNDDAQRIITTLRSTNGQPFSFVAPRETAPRRWLVKSWNRTSPYADADNLTATFEERPPAAKSLI